MKKSLLVVALVAVLVFAFATAAFATSAKTWNYNTDYYTWGSTSGEGAIATGTVLSSIGDNPSNPGVHAGYTANTAKCGICHSVHRAKGDGVKLLNTAVASCAGCHRAGMSVTNVVVSWQIGGPHTSGSEGTQAAKDAACNVRGCHSNNPHGGGASQYVALRSKLITAAADAGIAVAKDVAGSGVTTALLATSSDMSNVSSTRTGYTCNISGCHDQTMLSVINKGWSEDRKVVYSATPGTAKKTGHMTAGAGTNAFSFAAVSDCESCHDQTDAGTRTGFTFPHSQTAYGASNTSVRSYLWMTVSDEFGNPRGAMTGTNSKPLDGACLKCHRDGAAGIGITH